MKKILGLFLALVSLAFGQGQTPAAATQTQVNAGTLGPGFYVTPAGLAGWTPTGGSGLIPWSRIVAPSISAGAGITVSGSWPTISISAPGAGGTVTQVTVGAGLTVTNTTSTPAITLTTSIPVGNLNGGASAGPLTYWRGDGTWAQAVSQVTVGAGLTVTNTITTPVVTLTTSIPVGNLNGGSGASSSTFWRGDGTWAAISAGTVTQVAGTAGRVTVTNTTSTAVVTLPTTLSLSDTTLFLGSLSGTILLGNLTVTLSGNSALQSASTASSNFGGVFQVGTTSASASYGYPGALQQGYLVGTGMNQFLGGFTGPVDTISAWWNKLYSVVTTSNSQLPVIHFGDSFGIQVWNVVDPQAFNAVGFAGLGGYDVSVTLGGTAATVTNAFTFNPAGTVETLTATNDSVIYFVSGGSQGMSDRPLAFYARKANGATVKVQTASASPPAFSFGAFSDEAGYTAVSTSGSATTVSISLPKTPGYAWRIKFILTDTGGGAGATINFRPAFYSVSQSGMQTYNLSVGGISLSDSNTISTSYLAPFISAINPGLVTFHMSEGNTYVGTALEDWKTKINLTASTSVLIMGNPPNGTVGGAENNNPTSAQELQNGYLSSFAQRNGYQYYDIYGFMKNWLWLDSLGLGGDGTHISTQALNLVATKIIRDMGITGQNMGSYPNGTAPSSLGGASPQSMYGPTATATGTVAFTMNPLGSYVPTYYTLRIRTDHDQNYTVDNALIDIRNNLSFTDGTTARVTITASGGMQLGESGNAVIFPGPRSSGHTQLIYVDQTGSSSALMTGNPGVSMFNANSDTYGSAIFRNGAGVLALSSGSFSGTEAISLVVAGTVALTATSGGVVIPPTITTTSISGTALTVSASGVLTLRGSIINSSVTTSGTTPNIGSYLFPNQTAGTAAQGAYYTFGVANTSNNAGVFQFNYIGAGSANNSMAFAMLGQASYLRLFPNGVAIGTSGTPPATTGGFLVEGASVFSGVTTHSAAVSFSAQLNATTISGTSLTNGVPIVGTNTASNAAAGNVGEIITSAVAVGSAVSLASNTTTNATSISLTAGDWDVEGNVNFNAGSATVTAMSAGITTTSATVPSDGTEGYSGALLTVTSATDTITLPRKRISLSATTTVYLVGRATFSAGTDAIFGSITARRVR